MSQIEVRNKLRKAIRDLTLKNLENNIEIPPEISNHILTGYGWTTEQTSQKSLDDFIKTLQNFIEDSMPSTNITKKESLASFDNVFDEYLEAEREYCQVMSELVSALEESVKFKETYVLDFKEQCKFLEESVEVSNKKILLTKLQFLIKLYSEKNALVAHLELQSILKKDLEAAKKSYEEIVELNQQYDEIKNNKSFCELFKTYKELKKIEKRRDIFDSL